MLNQQKYYSISRSAVIYFTIAPDKMLFSNQKFWIFFLFLHKNVCSRYSLEVPRWGTSNDCLQHMFFYKSRRFYEYLQHTFLYKNSKRYLLDILLPGAKLYHFCKDCAKTWFHYFKMFSQKYKYAVLKGPDKRTCYKPSVPDLHWKVSYFIGCLWS